MGCFGLNLIHLRLQAAKKLMRKNGLENRMVKTQNKSSIDCWIPLHPVPGKPSLLLIHGFAFNALLEWEYQIQPFADKFNLYIPNLLFFGDSTTESSERSEVFQAECMKELMDELQVKRAHVLGTSYGGMVAYWMAHLYPSMVSKLVLANAAVVMDCKDVEKLVQRYGGGARHVGEMMMPTSVEGARRSMEFATRKSVKLLPTCLIQDIIEEVFCHNRELRFELLDGMKIGAVQNAPTIPVVEQSVLVLWGRDDQIFPLEMAERLHKHLGEVARLEVIPASAHTPQVDSFRTFNTSVVDFLAP